MRGFLFALLAATTFASPAVSQIKAIEWEGAVCHMRVEFDPAREDEQALRNTIDVIFGDVLAQILGAMPDQPRRPAFNMHEEPKDPAAVRDYLQRCDADTTAQAKDALINLPSMEANRTAAIASQRDFCRYQASWSQVGPGNYAALRLYAPATAGCSTFVDALEGKLSLTEVWKQTVEGNCARNVDQSECLSRWLSQAAEPDHVSRMRSDVLTYGWRNCAVRYLYANRMYKAAEEQRLSLDREFRARFKVTETDCIDTD